MTSQFSATPTSRRVPLGVSDAATDGRGRVPAAVQSASLGSSADVQHEAQLAAAASRRWARRGQSFDVYLIAAICIQPGHTRRYQ